MGINRIEPTLQLGETTLENVHYFPYLGSNLSANGDINDEIQYSLRCTGIYFWRIRARVFQDRDIRTDTKVLIYTAIVIPMLLYPSEIWTTYLRHLKTLENFHQRCLRNILNINWEDRRTNVSLLNEAKATSIEVNIIKNHLRWNDHVIRMKDECSPKMIFYSQLKEGERKKVARREGTKTL